MSLRRSLFHRAAHLALLAALALTWLPTLSRAMGPVDLAPQGAALCRADDDRLAAHALDRCAHCLLAAAPWLPTAPHGGAPDDHRVAVTAPALPAGRPAGPVRAAASARAPPAGA